MSYERLKEGLEKAIKVYRDRNESQVKLDTFGILIEEVMNLEIGLEKKTKYLSRILRQDTKSMTKYQYKSYIGEMLSFLLSIKENFERFDKIYNTVKKENDKISDGGNPNQLIFGLMEPYLYDEGFKELLKKTGFLSKEKKTKKK